MLGVTVQSQVPVVANAEIACGTKLMNKNIRVCMSKWLLYKYSYMYSILWYNNNY